MMVCKQLTKCKILLWFHKHHRVGELQTLALEGIALMRLAPEAYRAGGRAGGRAGKQAGGRDP